MSKAIRLIALTTLSCAGIATCATAAAQTPSFSPPGTPDCVGLSVCTPPPPDAEGNPPCYYSDGWQPTGSGTGIEVWYFREPQNLSKPETITALVRKKDGSNESQEANIQAGQGTHRFEFPNVDKSAVQEVLLSTGNSRCFVAGPTG